VGLTLSRLRICAEQALCRLNDEIRLTTAWLTTNEITMVRLGIFKHYKDKISGKYLSFDEIISRGMLYCNDGRVLNKNNILAEENSKIEIKFQLLI
jgi:hypothetical protein